MSKHTQRTECAAVLPAGVQCACVVGDGLEGWKRRYQMGEETVRKGMELQEIYHVTSSNICDGILRFLVIYSMYSYYW